MPVVICDCASTGTERHKITKTSPIGFIPLPPSDLHPESGNVSHLTRAF
jgi:hypothetical protein